MHCVTDFTIIFQLRCFTKPEDKWTELSEKEEQNVWNHFRHDDIKKFFMDKYGASISTNEGRKMKCRAYDSNKVSLLLHDVASEESDSQLSQDFRKAVKWSRDDVSVSLAISADDYSAGMAFCALHTDAFTDK